MDSALPAAITIDEFRRWRADGLVHALLDVREARELAVCGLDGALHVPMSEVPARLSELPRDRPLVVMCHHGMRSRMVTQYLRGQGFGAATNLEGGIDAWAAQADPAMARY